MPSLSPLYTLSLPVLFSLTLPFAFFATLTTIFAFGILTFRLAIIYIGIGFELISHYILGRSKPRTNAIPLIFQDGPFSTPTSSRSLASSASSSTVSFADQYGQGRFIRRKRKTSLPTRQKSPMAIDTRRSNTIIPFSLPLSTAPSSQRDFEGVGGWRFNSSPEDTKLFTSINSRLELPGTTLPIKIPETNSRQRHHKRSATSGSLDMDSLDSLLPFTGSKRHYSTFDLSHSHSTETFHHSQDNMGRIRSNSTNDFPSSNTSRPRVPALLSVSPLIPSESNRASAKHFRSRSDEYFMRKEDAENRVGLGLGGDGLVKKRSSVVSIAEDERERMVSGGSPDSRRSSGTEEGLNMKGR